MASRKMFPKKAAERAAATKRFNNTPKAKLAKSAAKQGKASSGKGGGG